MSYDLYVARSGTGSGTVTSNVAGIDCGSDCSQNYDHGTTLTLIATPTSSSTFTGRSGACVGMGPCEVTMDQARDVTAGFMGKSAISLWVRKTSAQLKLDGLVSPAHPDKSVAVTLSKKKAGKFAKLASKRLPLDVASRYATAFRRPSGGTCRIRASFSDTDHVPSSILKTFKC